MYVYRMGKHGGHHLEYDPSTIILHVYIPWFRDVVALRVRMFCNVSLWAGAAVSKRREGLHFNQTNYQYFTEKVNSYARNQRIKLTVQIDFYLKTGVKGTLISTTFSQLEHFCCQSWIMWYSRDVDTVRKIITLILLIRKMQPTYGSAFPIPRGLWRRW